MSKELIDFSKDPNFNDDDIVDLFIKFQNSLTEMVIHESQMSLTTLDIELNPKESRLTFTDDNDSAHLYHPLRDWFERSGSLQPTLIDDQEFQDLVQQAFSAAKTDWDWAKSPVEKDIQLLHYKHDNWLVVYSEVQGTIIMNLYNITKEQPSLNKSINRFELIPIQAFINMVIQELTETISLTKKD